MIQHNQLHTEINGVRYMRGDVVRVASGKSASQDFIILTVLEKHLIVQSVLAEADEPPKLVAINELAEYTVERFRTPDEIFLFMLDRVTITTSHIIRFIQDYKTLTLAEQRNVRTCILEVLARTKPSQNHAILNAILNA